MSENDLSDEAYLKWMSKHASAVYPRDAWEECARRAEIRITEAEQAGFERGAKRAAEDRRKDFEAGRMSILKREGYEEDNSMLAEEGA